MSYSVVHVDEIEGAGPGGGVPFVRRELGVEAFGINSFEIPPTAKGHEHDETRSGQGNETRSGQGEVSIGARRGAYEPRGPF